MAKSASERSKDKTAQREGKNPPANARSVISPGHKFSILALQRTVGNRAVGRLLEETVNRREASGEEMPGGPQPQAETRGARSLDPATRTLMESRFSSDFGDVRVHTSSEAARSARDINAEAYTTGQDIFFGEGRYSPETPEGQNLLAHELTHVVQQSHGGDRAQVSDAVLEAEASTVAQGALRGQRVAVNNSAAQGKVQCQPSTAAAKQQGPKWKAGNVKLSDAARDDVMVRGALFSGNDQAHVNVSKQGRLAYDENHTTPEDPFRWEKLKEIVDSGRPVEIFAVNITDDFKVKEIIGGKPIIVDRSLYQIGGNGVTLTRQKVAETIRAKEVAASAPPTQTAAPGQKPATATSQPQAAKAPAAARGREFFSPKDTHDRIYYNVSEIGSLAHELYGHLWLSIKGVPFTHPDPQKEPEEAKLMGTLSARHKILNPMGQVFTGTVKSYIDTYVWAHKQKQPPPSPTQGVSPDKLIAAMEAFVNEAKQGLRKVADESKNSPAGMKFERFIYSPALAQQWRIICNAYDVMPSHKEWVSAGNLGQQPLFKEILIILFASWFRNQLTPDQKKAFRIMLDDFKRSKAGFEANALSIIMEETVGSLPSPFKPAGP